jgi:predicted MFS family arabinose efflux permease
LADLGISGRTASWAIATIGIFNIAGTYLCGTFGGKVPLRFLLSAIYLGRAVCTTLFLLLPLSDFSVLAFGAGMGLLWLSTVPPTAQLVSCMFGTRYMSMLFGLVFLSHQVGGFVGVMLAAHLQSVTGSYTVVWWLSVALALFAALIHLPIRERRWANSAPHRAMTA